MKKIDAILKEVIKEIEPGKEEIKKIKYLLKKFISQLNSNIKNSGIDASVFVGGSFAKKTLIKKKEYDIDIFLRFNKKYSKQNISELAYSLLKDFKNLEKIHGSRDYFKIKADKNIIFEIIPVIKIKKPEQAENITDLSYFHVKFIRKNLGSQKILREVMLAKAFFYANGIYGAESHIRGFSGYAIELLIYRYKTFKNLLNNIIKINRKEIIDPAKHYKNKKMVFMDLNSSKLHSPIILIDPTYKQRNALAALSMETLVKLQKTAEKFLKNPSAEYFKKRKPYDYEKIKRYAIKKKYNFALVAAETPKQAGAVAGSKLLKFFNYLSNEVEKFFVIKKKGFEYLENNSANYFFVTEPKKEITYKGPLASDKLNSKKFREKHSKIIIKKNRLYAFEKAPKNLKKFLEDFYSSKKNQIKEMHISKIAIKDST